jgi:uncharacterized protein (TIGR00725 family)
MPPADRSNFLYNLEVSRKPVIAVVGAGRDTELAASNAHELGRLIARNGWVLISGGRDAGVMKAANEGAKEVDGSLTIGILPDRESKPASAVDVTIITDVGNARNNVIVLSADVVVACGVDGAGTASEVSLAIKNGKPVVLLGVNEMASKFFTGIGGDQVQVVDTPEHAIEAARALLS